MPEWFSNNEGNEVSGGEYIATPGDSQAKYFSDCKNMRITGGRYGTVDRTDTTQTSGGASSNATRSPTFSQDWNDGYSHPSRQRTGTEADQQDALSPYGRSNVRKGSGGSILAAPHQVANDPESYDTVQAMQNPPTLPTVASSALRTHTTPSSNKGTGGGSSHHMAHGMRSDSGGSSSSRTNTAPPSSKRNDNTTQYVQANPLPPPRPPKPPQLRNETSHEGPPPIGRNYDPNRGGSYPNPPPPPPITTGTGQTGYPSPGPSPPRGQIFDQAPLGSPEVLHQPYQSSPPISQTPHRQTLPFRAGAPQMGYPSPEPSPLVYGGPYRPAPQVLPTSPTTNLRRRRDNPPPFDMLQWSNSEPAPTPSHGDSRFMGTSPPMNRSITMPIPFSYHGPAATTTNPTPSPPYDSQYDIPAHDRSPYNASTDYTHHSGPSSRYPPAPHPPNYPSAQDNYYRDRPDPRSQERAPSFPEPHVPFGP